MYPEEHDYQVEQEESRRENDAMIQHTTAEDQIIANKITIDIMLKHTKRRDMNHLRDYLNESDFYTIPASKRFHNNEKGGLAKHCLSVYSLFYNHIHKLGIKDIPHDSIVICSLLHDLCKITPKTREHARMSLERIQKHITLTKLEIEIILFHMGYYYTHEFSQYMGEFTLMELKTAQNNPIVKLFHWCDDMNAQFTGVKK